MAITPQKVNFNNIEEVKAGDGITPDHINAPLKASALSQALATNPIDISEIASDKEPSLEIVGVENNNPRLKATGLQGKSPTTLTVDGIAYNIRTTTNLSDKGLSGYITFVLET